MKFLAYSLFTFSDYFAFAVASSALEEKPRGILDDPYKDLRYKANEEKGNGGEAFNAFYRIRSIDNYTGKSIKISYRKNMISGLQDREDIKRWLSPKEIEALVKENRSKRGASKRKHRSFDPYFWTEDGGKTWKDLYPFVRPDYGWWMTQKISDYTVKINYKNHTSLDTQVSNGTGWFLDFVEPEDEKYPLRWYLVTNAHVIDTLRLIRDPYKQGLPEHCVKLWWKFGKCSSERSITLYKDARVDSHRMPVDKDPMTVWGKNSEEYKEEHNGLGGKSDSFLWAGNEVESPDDVLKNKHPILWADVKKVDLLYFPANFMKFSDGIFNHAVDMSVLEITFDNELIARRMTNNLYDKYYSDKAYGVPLNFLSENAERAFLVGNTRVAESFFTLGYPHNAPSPYRAYGNYSQITRTAGLARSMFTGDKFNYHKIEWADVDYTRSKDFYLYGIERIPGAKGTSGSMVVDMHGNVLGLISLGVRSEAFSLVSPLRNSSKNHYKWFHGENRSVGAKTKGYRDKKFDLISGGVEGQRNSYADVLKTYGKKTYLSRVNGWSKENNSRKTI